MVSFIIEACHARGIASNDNEWFECLNEAKQTHSPRKLRELFAFICGLNIPANALRLWETFKVHLAEDYLRQYSNNENVAYNKAMLEIEDILSVHNVTCASLGLPTPTVMPDIVAFDLFDPVEANNLYIQMYYIMMLM